MKKLPIIIAVIITALVVGGGMYWYQNTKTSQPAIISEESDKTEKEIIPEKIIDNPIEGVLSDENFKTEIPFDFHTKTQGSKSFDKKTIAKLYENEEEIGAIFPHPSMDSSVIFTTCIQPHLATNAPDGGVFETATSRIYSYNFKTDELVKLYDENNKQYYCFIGMGMEGSKLILRKYILDDSPGLCSSPWVGYSKSFLSLELSDISAGLQLYTVPADKIEEEKAKADKCETELE